MHYLEHLYFLLFDTLGRLAFSPIEIPADLIMMVIGGPAFYYSCEKRSKLMTNIIEIKNLSLVIIKIIISLITYH